MQNLNLFSIFIDKLDGIQISYFITGSIASIVYGEPRLTHDIDIVILLETNQANKILNAFPQNEFYCPPEEVIKTETLRSSRGHFNIIQHETGFKADIYLAGTDQFQNWALLNKKEIDFLGKKIFIAPIEYVIVMKLEFYREGNSQKHLTDIKNMLAFSNDKIDYELLNKFINNFGLQKEWELVN